MQRVRIKRRWLQRVRVARAGVTRVNATMLCAFFAHHMLLQFYNVLLSLVRLYNKSDEYIQHIHVPLLRLYIAHCRGMQLSLYQEPGQLWGNVRKQNKYTLTVEDQARWHWLSFYVSTSADLSSGFLY